MTVARRGIAPYLVVLLVTLFLFYQTTHLGFEAPGGRIGPDVWPNIVLILAILVCAYEIARRLLARDVGPGVAGGPGDELDEMSGEGPEPGVEPGPTYPWLVAAGVAMSIAYVALLGILGFFLCTTLYLAGFIILGGYRRIVVTALTSVLGSLVFLFMFMKIVYISLPLGIEPFAQLSYLLMRLMGVR